MLVLEAPSEIFTLAHATSEPEFELQVRVFVTLARCLTFDLLAVFSVSLQQ